MVFLRQKPKLNDVMELHAVAQDIGTRAILVTTAPSVGEDLKNLANKLSVKVLKEEDLARKP